jgi:large subunit ribosomal protein L10
MSHWRFGGVNRREKERVVSELHERLQDFRAVILTDYRGLSVDEMTRLRRQLREANVQYRVVKNTLMRLASKETGLEALSDLFVGPTAMAVSDDDPLAPARVLSGFSKEIPLLEIKGGLVEGRVVGPQEIEGMAKLPGREVLLGNVLRLLRGGQLHLVNVLSAQVRRLVQVLGAIRVARQGEEEAKAEVEVKEEAEEEAKAEVEVKEEAEEEAKAEVEVQRKRLRLRLRLRKRQRKRLRLRLRLRKRQRKRLRLRLKKNLRRKRHRKAYGKGLRGG